MSWVNLHLIQMQLVVLPLFDVVSLSKISHTDLRKYTANRRHQQCRGISVNEEKMPNKQSAFKFLTDIHWYQLLLHPSLESSFYACSDHEIFACHRNWPILLFSEVLSRYNHIVHYIRRPLRTFWIPYRHLQKLQCWYLRHLHSPQTICSCEIFGEVSYKYETMIFATWQLTYSSLIGAALLPRVGCSDIRSAVSGADMTLSWRGELVSKMKRKRKNCDLQNLTKTTAHLASTVLCLGQSRHLVVRAI